MSKKKMKRIKLIQKNWLEELDKEYDHPAIVLWRAIELKTIFQSLRGKRLLSPILDLGCGEGKIAKVLFGKGVVDIGLDNESEMVKAARKSKVYKKVVLGDAQDLPFRNNSLSTVFSNSVIEHIQGIEKVLSEVSRILKPGGLFIFTVPSHKFGDFLFFSLLFKKIKLDFLGKKYTQMRNKKLNHYHCYSPRQWGTLLKKAGLKMDNWQYYLSKETLSFWDKLAFEILFLRATGFLLSKQMKPKVIVWHKKRQVVEIRRHFRLSSKEVKLGGGLLIIAKK